ncbi:threonine/serine exporter family protein [Lactobacillus sp. ESL0731]|uniref:threonine/serine exporter family protein n=1 Tax=unclassified Lactobacillus TaxID=2620435 RepID=UPI0023F6A803|nr:MULTISPECIES: threonine/serine exporter family protein [unclassified Lactobacillus]WEV51834.1 threonine/serine exporter family protein [Lactobacillus sp. ESL0700]WEV62964.1 threonine/serine exporter family protein [Lactobacillus sp. ESL0731]
MENKAIDVGVLAAKILIESGSEMWRVEDTTKRIIDHAASSKAEAFTSLTGVLVSLKNASYTRFIQIEKRGINMARINGVNRLSRQYTANQITLDELEAGLNQVQAAKPQFPIWVQTLAAGFESSFFMFIFTQTYDWRDFPLAFVAGALGYYVTLFLSSRVRIRFISEFFGALVIGLCTVIGVHFHLGFNSQNIIIGAIMPPVPGIPMIIAVRDIFEGNLLSGLERMMECLITLSALAFGIGVVLHYL